MSRSGLPQPRIAPFGTACFAPGPLYVIGFASALLIFSSVAIKECQGVMVRFVGGQRFIDDSIGQLVGCKERQKWVTSTEK